MGKNTSISLGDHFEFFISECVKSGRYASTSDAVRAGLRLLEQEESRLDLLRETLAKGEIQLDQGKGLDGEHVFEKLMS